MESKPKGSDKEESDQEAEKIAFYCILIGCSDYDLKIVGTKTGKLMAAVANIKKMRQLIAVSKFANGEIKIFMDSKAKDIESYLDDTLKEIRTLCHKVGK